MPEQKNLEAIVKRDYKATAIYGLMTAVSATYSGTFGKLMYDGQLKADGVPAAWLLMLFPLATTAHFVYRAAKSLRKG